MRNRQNSKTKKLIFLIWVIIIAIFISCKEEYLTKPIIRLKKEAPFVYENRKVHLNEEIEAGIVLEAVGEGNEITNFELSKNDSMYFDTVLNKEYVFFKLKLLIDTYDSTLYYLAAYDVAYNLGEYFIKTFRVIDTIPRYDTIYNMDTTILMDYLSIDTVKVDTLPALIVKSIDRTDTLIYIDL